MSRGNARAFDVLYLGFFFGPSNCFGNIFHPVSKMFLILLKILAMTHVFNLSDSIKWQ